VNLPRERRNPSDEIDDALAGILDGHLARGSSTTKSKPRRIAFDDFVEEILGVIHPSATARCWHRRVAAILEELGRTETTIGIAPRAGDRDDRTSRILNDLVIRRWLRWRRPRGAKKHASVLLAQLQIVAAICSYALGVGYIERTPFSGWYSSPKRWFPAGTFAGLPKGWRRVPFHVREAWRPRRPDEGNSS
jgi:hypothetical protein